MNHRNTWSHPPRKQPRRWINHALIAALVCTLILAIAHVGPKAIAQAKYDAMHHEVKE